MIKAHVSCFFAGFLWSSTSADEVKAAFFLYGLSSEMTFFLQCDWEFGHDVAQDTSCSLQ